MITSAVIAAALALIGFVITQSILKFVIEPVQEQRKLIGEVANALVVYGSESIDLTPKEWFERASDNDKKRVTDIRNTLRTFSGRLRASLWSIPFYGAFARAKIVPNPADVLEASRAFISWSNNLVGKEASDGAREAQDIVANKLGIVQKYEKLRQ
jgi:hypothetical protein